MHSVCFSHCRQPHPVQRARCARTSIQNIKRKSTKRTLAAKSNLTLTAFHQNGFANDISILQTSHRQTHTTDAVVQRKCAAKPPRRQTLQNNRECPHIVKICVKIQLCNSLTASQLIYLFALYERGRSARARVDRVASTFKTYPRWWTRAHTHALHDAIAAAPCIMHVFVAATDGSISTSLFATM